MNRRDIEVCCCPSKAQVIYLRPGKEINRIKYVVLMAHICTNGFIDRHYLLYLK